MDYLHTLNTYLSEFAKYESQFPGPIPDSISFQFNKHKGHVVFGSIIHGNEVGSLPAIIKIIQKLSTGEIKYGGKVTFFLGNKKAALEKIRFTEYDLNRSFGYTAKGNSSFERSRALEIMKILENADVFIDFHQTNRPSVHPFYIFSMHAQSYYWAQAAGVAPAFITRKPGEHFSEAGMCSDEFMRTLKKPGITLELGEQGFRPHAAQYTTTVTLRTLKNMDMVYNKITTIQKLAKKNKEFDFYITTYQEPFNNPQKCLKEGFNNFDKINYGDHIGTDEYGKPLISKKEGFILFPKYPILNEKGQLITPLPGELYVLAERLKEHPLSWI